MSDLALYVLYSVTEPKDNRRTMEVSSPSIKPLTPELNANKALESFLNAQTPVGKAIEAYTEVLKNRRSSKWPQLQKALLACKQHNASLLITELGTLTANKSFTQVLLEADVAFHCLDQPFINQTNLEALSKHAEVQRELHGKLIRQGLKMTSAKSGNPNAAEVISKVNKPKIDTAIVFAYLIQPIIRDYRLKGYSQRQMVKTLNEVKFKAPQGGEWVLSQLQKVLDRLRLNEIANELKIILEDLQISNSPLDQIAVELNAKAIPALKPPGWDAIQVKKLQDRIKQITEITLINRLVLDLLPVLHEYRQRQMSPTQMLMSFEQAGITIRQSDALAA